jgi:hypothetical protein
MECETFGSWHDHLKRNELNFFLLAQLAVHKYMVHLVE